MKFNLRPTAGWATVLVAVLAAAPAAAQDGQRPTLPAEIYQVAGSFTAQQQQAVAGYAAFYTDLLVNGTDADVVEARAQLIAPLTKGGTEQFNNQYAAAVSVELAGSVAMQSERSPDDSGEQRGGVIVRLNTMIVVSRLLKDDRVVALILEGIEDDNPAVRYWAVRAARGAVDTLSAQQRSTLTGALRRMVGTEEVDEVVRQLLLALIDLDAVDAVAQALNELIDLHVGSPRLTYDAKREAMRALLQKLQVMEAQGVAVEATIRQLARAAGRYMALITQQAQATQLDEQTANDHLAMLRLADTVLRTVHQRFGATTAAPQSIQATLQAQNWQALTAAANQWRQVLAGPPFNFSDADLAVTGQ